ncbi:MAG TPA: ATPase, T2SS/T4P/T4SS family, partial [Burkholderiaceae bacterium]|nr:ATPase, T2SS/T4P/T4SS family [Burkholderiaceae bacterium]
MPPSHESLAQTLGVPFVPEHALSALQADWSRVSPAQAREQQLWPCRDAEGTALFILEQPASGALLGWLAARTHGPVRWGLTSPGALAALLQAHRGEGGSAQRAGEGQAVVQFVDQTIASAWSAQASDIHFETRRAGLTVRIRRDGVLTDLCRWEGSESPAEILSRLKVMAQLDIAERRLPQDGRIELQLHGNPIDLRIAVLPTIYGESCVMRVLDRSNVELSLDRIGLRQDDFDTFDRLIH